MQSDCVSLDMHWTGCAFINVDLLCWSTNTKCINFHIKALNLWESGSLLTNNDRYSFILWGETCFFFSQPLFTQCMWSLVCSFQVSSVNSLITVYLLLCYGGSNKYWITVLSPKPQRFFMLLSDLFCLIYVCVCVCIRTFLLWDSLVCIDCI